MYCILWLVRSILRSDLKSAKYRDRIWSNTCSHSLSVNKKWMRYGKWLPGNKTFTNTLVNWVNACLNNGFNCQRASHLAIGIHMMYVIFFFFFSADKHFWDHGYTLISKDVEECVPIFLRHIANDVYVCGKTINLLKICCPQVGLVLFPHVFQFTTRVGHHRNSCHDAISHTLNKGIPCLCDGHLLTKSTYFTCHNF